MTDCIVMSLLPITCMGCGQIVRQDHNSDVGFCFILHGQAQFPVNSLIEVLFQCWTKNWGFVLAGIRVLQRGAMSSIENPSHLLSSYGSSGRTHHHSRASWPLNDYVHRPTLALVCLLCAHWILNCPYMCAGLRYFKQSAAEKWEDQLWLLESQNKDFVVLHPGRNSCTVIIISISTTCESCAWVSKESGIDKTVVPPLLLFVASLKLTLGLHLHKRGGASSMVMPIFYGNSV
jgi:hypothetical protein